jgi:hypothetical protein
MKSNSTYIPQEATCPHCGEPGTVTLYNTSFGHAFGRERRSTWLMDCCNVPPPRYWEPDEYGNDPDAAWQERVGI